MTEPIKRRRWFRFSLRMLLVVVTVLCVWLGLKVNAARRQKLAVEAILKVGGEVDFDYQTVPNPNRPGDVLFDRNAPPPGPEWLHSVFGDDFFRNVIGVSFVDCDATSFDFAQLAKLPCLKSIDLLRTSFDASCVSHFVNIKSLNCLLIESRRIDDTALAEIGKLSSLEYLRLTYAQITDQGLSQIQNLTNLKQLYLDGTPITGVGIKLGNSKKLELLAVTGTRLNDEGLEQVGKLSSLETLVLSGTPVSDNGLEHIQNLSKLESLTLNDTAITDVGLRFLKSLTSLQMLSIQRTRVTSAGISDFRKSLKNAQVYSK